MNRWGRVVVSLRNRSTKSRASLARLMTRLLHVNMIMGATYVRPSCRLISVRSLTLRPLCLGILDPFCREHNIVASKVGAKAILQALLGLPVTPEDVPTPEHLPGDLVALHQTVTEADVIPTQGNVQVERD